MASANLPRLCLTFASFSFAATASGEVSPAARAWVSASSWNRASPLEQGLMNSARRVIKRVLNPDV